MNLLSSKRAKFEFKQLLLILYYFISRKRHIKVRWTLVDIGKAENKHCEFWSGDEWALRGIILLKLQSRKLALGTFDDWEVAANIEFFSLKANALLSENKP